MNYKHSNFNLPTLNSNSDQMSLTCLKSNNNWLNLLEEITKSLAFLIDYITTIILSDFRVYNNKIKRVIRLKPQKIVSLYMVNE